MSMRELEMFSSCVVCPVELVFKRSRNLRIYAYLVAAQLGGRLLQSTSGLKLGPARRPFDQENIVMMCACLLDGYLLWFRS